MHLKYVAMRIHPSQVMQYEYLQLSLLCKLYRSSNTTPNETPEIQNLRCKKTRNSSFFNNFRCYACDTYVKYKTYHLSAISQKLTCGIII